MYWLTIICMASVARLVAICGLFAVNFWDMWLIDGVFHSPRIFPSYMPVSGIWMSVYGAYISIGVAVVKASCVSSRVPWCVGSMWIRTALWSDG